MFQKLSRKVHSMILSMPARIQKARLKRIYTVQAQHLGAYPLTHAAEQTDPGVLALAWTLRREILAEYHHKYRQEAYRVLFHLPESGIGGVWFKDLKQILEYTGIPCATVDFQDASFYQRWNTFQPTVFISMDFPKTLSVLDLDFIQVYKQRQGCLRLLTTYPKEKFPKPECSPQDRWRLDLARAGKSADAFFCMYVRAYYTAFLPEWEQAGFAYLPLPHGCNPLTQIPLSAEKTCDYFLATSCGPERIQMTWQIMKPIFETCQGVWAGPGWGFGIGPINPDQLALYYARAKIVPNPMSPSLIQYPMEISERAFSAMACGAFQITDWTPVTSQFFAADELVQAHGKEDFLEKFMNYLNRPEERNEILRKGLKRLYAEHTYFHRIDALIDFFHQQADLF